MRATRYDRYRRAQNADHFAHNSPFSAFFAEVVCTLGMTPPRTVISPPPKGVCTTSMEGTARSAGPGYGTHGLQCPWAGRSLAGLVTATQATPVWRVPEGTEGQAAVPMGGARPGRASRRRTQPRTATQAPPVWRVPEGTEGQGGLRDRPLRAVGSRVAISRAAGPDGTRNTSGTTSKTISQVARRPRAHQAARPQHTHSDACPHAIQA